MDNVNLVLIDRLVQKGADASLMDSLVAFMAGGQRRIDRWTGQHRCANVRFEDDRAFFNANTPEDLRA